jgi:phosphoglycerate dehydrogenase-like enzyme
MDFRQSNGATFHHRVVLVGGIYHAEADRLLRQSADVAGLTSPTVRQIKDALRDAHGAIVRYPHRIDDSVLAEATNLIVVASSGRGIDSIDVRACSDRGIVVVNNPGLGTRPVSEHAMALMLALSRRLFQGDRAVRAGGAWERRTDMGIEDLHGRKLGIVGLGLIGTEMARKCKLALGMEVVAYDPHIQPDHALEAGVTLVDSLEELLGRVDVVSLHCELNAETQGMIGVAQFRRMQPHAYFLNTSRGKVVQQGALIRALEEQWIAGAALDVYEDEPLDEESLLFGLPNLLLSPHVAGLSKDALWELANSAATQVLDVLSGRSPRSLVNPQSWEPAMERLSRVGRPAPSVLRRSQA